MRRREAEVTQLRKAMEMVDGGACAQAIATEFRYAREEEVRLAVGEKHKELELYASLLKVRDRQIGELQHLCEEKQANLQQLQQLQQHQQRQQEQQRSSALPGSSREAHGAGTAAEEALTEARAEVQLLRREKDELERLVVSKDRQLAAVQGVDAGMSDTSALQLGAQAIQMFHDSMRLRAEDMGCERENQDLREEVDRLAARLAELEAEVEDKRTELKDMADALTSKMQRCVDLEHQLEASRRDKAAVGKDAAHHLEKAREELTVWQQDCSNAQKLVEELRAQVVERDNRYALQQAELSQEKATTQRLERKVEEMGGQFAHAEEALAQMLRSNSYKDQLLRELTEQVSFSETKLHSYQINELMGSRQRREHEASVSKGVLSPAAANADVRAKVDALRELQTSPSFLDNSCMDTSLEETRLGTTVGNGLSSFLHPWEPLVRGSSLEASGLGEHHRRGQAAMGRSRSCASLGGLGTGAAAAGAAANVSTVLEDSMCSPTDPEASRLHGVDFASPRSAVRGARRARRPRSASSSQRPRGTPGADDARPVSEFRDCQPWGPASSAGAVSSAASARAAVAAGPISAAAEPGGVAPGGMGCVERGRSEAAATIFVGSSSTLSAQPAVAAQGYRPLPGDRIDEKVAEFVNKPENSGCRALFCRLGEGSYLYGTRRASLRVGCGTDRLETLLDGGWVAIEDFVRRLTGSQGVHVERAREAALVGGVA